MSDHKSWKKGFWKESGPETYEGICSLQKSVTGEGKMIKKYVYGEPFETEALTENIGDSRRKARIWRNLCRRWIFFTYIMDEEDIVYGLGESNRGINKRGFIYTSNCTDDPEHTEDKHSLYGAYNLIIVSEKKPLECFLTIRQRSPLTWLYQNGYHEGNLRKCRPEAYVIEGESPYDIVKQFRHVIGRSYIPPKFALLDLARADGAILQKRISGRLQLDIVKIIFLLI